MSNAFALICTDLNKNNRTYNVAKHIRLLLWGVYSFHVHFTFCILLLFLFILRNFRRNIWDKKMKHNWSKLWAIQIPWGGGEIDWGDKWRRKRGYWRKKRRGTDGMRDGFCQRRKGEKEEGMTAENARKHVERQTQTGGWREANRRVGNGKVREEWERKERVRD